MKFDLIKNKKQVKALEVSSTPFQNISDFYSKPTMFKRWMDVLRMTRGGARLNSIFGKPLYLVTYEFQNKVWGFTYKNYEFLLYRDQRGLSLQIMPKTPAKVIESFIKDFHSRLKGSKP